MEIIEIPVHKIRPDPHQPRQTIDDDHIEEMAQSVKSQGVINPIEVDSTYVIITGEQRWRAAKKAGLKTVPVKILKIDKEERFTRQVIENVHHHTMTDYDTAIAFQKLIGRSHAERGVRWLSRKIGKSPGYISEKLNILQSSAPLIKAIKSGELSDSYLRIITRTPEEHKKTIEKKILGGQFVSSHGGLEVAHALRRTPALAKEILAKDYSKLKNTQEIISAVSKISPRVTDQIITAIKPTDSLGKIVSDLLTWLDKNTPESVGKHNLHRVVINLSTAEKEVNKWLKKK